MPTEEVKHLVQDTLKNNKGPFGIVASILSLSILVLQLPHDAIERLQEVWFIIAVPSFIVFLAGFAQAYLAEHKNRTRVESKVVAELEQLGAHIERLFASHFDDKIYIDKALGKFSDEHKEIVNRLDRIYAVLEKRAELRHTGDTEKFLNGKQI